jgi:hypothetical protein
MQNTGLMVAKVLVNPNSCTVPVRLINLTDKPVTVFKDTTTAKLENVEIVDRKVVNAVKIGKKSENRYFT